MKYTPGPWKVGHENRVIGANSEVVCFGNRANDNDRENAILISAALDLLEVCEAFLRAPHIGSDGPGSSTIVVQEFHLRAARIAVEKATKY